MQLRMPRGQVVSPRRRGCAANRAARQAFFSSFLRGSGAQNEGCRKAEAGTSLASHAHALLEKLIVGKIVRPRLRRRSEYLIALDGNAAMSARNGLIFARVGGDDPGAARGQTINQLAIGRNSKHSDPHRTLARRRCRRDPFLFIARTRLSGSRRLCGLGAFRRFGSSLALSGAFRNRPRGSGRNSARRGGGFRLPARCLFLLKIRRWGLGGILSCRTVRRWLVR